MPHYFGILVKNWPVWTFDDHNRVNRSHSRGQELISEMLDLISKSVKNVLEKGIGLDRIAEIVTFFHTIWSIQS